MSDASSAFATLCTACSCACEKGERNHAAHTSSPEIADPHLGPETAGRRDLPAGSGHEEHKSGAGGERERENGPCSFEPRHPTPAREGTERAEARGPDSAGGGSPEADAAHAEQRGLPRAGSRARSPEGPQGCALSLVGGSGREAFLDLALLENGYAVYGRSSCAGDDDLPFLAVFTRDLELVSQTLYRGDGVCATSFARLEDADAYVLAVQSCGRRADTQALLRVGGAEKEVEHVRALGGAALPSSLSRVRTVPPEFSGRARIVSASSVSLAGEATGFGYLCAYGGALELLAVTRAALPENDVVYSDVCVTEEQVVVVGCAAAGPGTDRDRGLLVAHDAALNVTRTLAFAGAGHVRLTHIQPLDRGFAVAGTVEDDRDGRRKILVLRLDADFSLERQAVVAGEVDDAPTSLDADPDRGLLLSGLTRGRRPGSLDGLLLQLDAELRILRELAVEGVDPETGLCARFAPDGGVVFAGATAPRPSGGDAYIASLPAGWNAPGPLAGYPGLVLNAGSGWTQRLGGQVRAMALRDLAAEFLWVPRASLALRAETLRFREDEVWPVH